MTRRNTFLTLLKNNASDYTTNSFSYDSQHILTDIRVNQTSVTPLYLAGNAVDNSCNVGTFSDRFGTWNIVNVEGIILITIASYSAKVDLLHDEISLRSN